MADDLATVLGRLEALVGGEAPYTLGPYREDLRTLLAAYDAQAARLAHTGTYCAFCTAEFPDEAPGTVEQIQRHVYVCPLHPMRQVERDRDEMDSQATRYRVERYAQAARLAELTDTLQRVTDLIDRFGPHGNLAYGLFFLVTGMLGVFLGLWLWGR